jgi:FMN phosphatase YigB (HAD superfamily)
MSRFAVLFDVDKVLVRNKNLNASVSNNCAKFIKQVSLKPMSNELATAKKEILEQRYGHFLRGIYSTYGPKYDNLIDHFFIEQVYTHDIYQELIEYLDSREFKEHSENFNEILTLCCDNDIPVSIFSNSPYDWCRKVVNKVELTPYINDIYSFDHHLTYPRLLKPDPEVYSNIENHIRLKNVNEINQIYLIDGSPDNLRPIQFNNLWKPVLFDPERLHRNNFCRITTSLQEVKDFINHNCTLLKNEKKSTIYLKRHEVKNVLAIKMALRSCIPYLSDHRVEEIINETIKNGHSPLVITTQSEITKITRCMEYNGLECYVENTF